MNQKDFEIFLRETLPGMGYAWRMLSRKNVRRKVRRRMESLRIQELGRYRELIMRNPEEAAVFQSLLRVTITRFFRNAEIWEQLGQIIVQGCRTLDAQETISCWSAGCAGGEEPYSLAMLLDQLSRRDGLLNPWAVLGTDSDEASLERTGELNYRWGSVREVPEHLLHGWFDNRDDRWFLRPEITANITICSHDTLSGPPPGAFHIALVRNSIFTYNTPDVRRKFVERVRESLVPPGLLVIGRKESLPERSGFEKVGKCIYKKTAD